MPKRSKSRSRRSKSKIRIPISHQGALGQYGYRDIKYLTAQERHDALDRAVRAKGSLDVIRRLNALAILQKRTHPTLARKLRADQRYVSKLRRKSQSR